MTTHDSAARPRLDRRTALKWMATAAASAAWFDPRAFMAPGPAAGTATGYGTDPDLTKTYQPGEVWPLSFTAAQRVTATALCDTIIPADAKGPSASAVKVPDFIDEWISAPYPGHSDDKRIVLEGLAWLETESQRRFRNDFANLVTQQRNALCDDICHVPDAKPEHRQAAHFFRRFRDLTAGGYYTTPEGMRDIGYVGNVALEKFEGPPPEVLKILGLA